MARICMGTSSESVVRSVLAVSGLCLLGFGLSTSVAAQTTSRIEGTVRSPDGEPIAGVELRAESATLGRSATSGADGRYRIPALPAGTYDLSAAHEGFTTSSFEDLEVAVNSTLVLDIELQVGALSEVVTVSAEPPLLETATSDTGGVVTPRQIETLPVNGRNYLDLMQLVPGVTVNRQSDEGSDSATPILGDRAGNTVYLLDGMPNRNEFGSGASSQFNQDTIQEFQVLTGGFKAEFGHGSAGVVNVVTKSGSNRFKGLVFGYVRDDSLDSSNSLVSGEDVPKLKRENYGVNLSGAPVRDRLFLFGSAEHIDEDRELNFTFPPNTPQVLIDFENAFDEPNKTDEDRLFLKLSEQIGPSHTVSQQISYNDATVTDFLPLSEAESLPSSRNDFDRERTMVGARDTSLFGEGRSPWLFEGYLQVRDESDQNRPAHPEAGPSTRLYLFSSTTTFTVFGDLGQVLFGNGTTDGFIDQEYAAVGPSLSRIFGDHELKFGVDTLRTKVDGQEVSDVENQVFATEENFLRYGPIFSGMFILRTIGGLEPGADQIRLRNDYAGLYVQDDWQVGNDLTLNLGVRWDRDSEFDDDNISPRIGFAWTPEPRTVVRGSFGLFYDRFRLGLVRNVPAFGGSDLRAVQPISYPQLFHNLTTIVMPFVFGPCVNPIATQAEIEASGAPCFLGLPIPQYGFDYLNGFVAQGHAPIPPGTVVTEDNVLELSGLSAEEFLGRVRAAVPLAPGIEWFWGPFGTLTHTAVPDSALPTTLDPRFATPYSRAFHLGVQHQFGRNQLVAVDYHHKEFENILGIRQTNLAFESRLPGMARTYLEPSPGIGIRGYGPWFEGEIDAVTVSYTRRLSNRFSLSAHYTYTDATDNMAGANLGNGAFEGPGAGNAAPIDNFVGEVPLVTDPNTGETNADGSFVASNGSFIPQAGSFYNGPDLDKGRSSLSLDHNLVLFGLVQLPLDFQISAILRYTSGFPYSPTVETGSDPDGDLNFTMRDLSVERNSMEAPSYKNLDLRVAKLFDIGERVRATVLVEFFNVTNEQNPAAIETQRGRQNFGQPLQVLPGREGQIGLRLEF